MPLVLRVPTEVHDNPNVMHYSAAQRREFPIRSPTHEVVKTASSRFRLARAGLSSVRFGPYSPFTFRLMLCRHRLIRNEGTVAQRQNHLGRCEDLLDPLHERSYEFTCKFRSIFRSGCQIKLDLKLLVDERRTVTPGLLVRSALAIGAGPPLRFL